MSDPRTAYSTLLCKLDAFFSRVQREHPGAMRCEAGCATCCQRDLSLFPFELERLVDAVGALDAGRRGRILSRARLAAEDPKAACPLLEDDRCQVYEARSVICRTHGLPCLITLDGREELSLCPLNFSGAVELGGDSVLDLNPVNQALATINHLICSERGVDPARVSISLALLEALDPEAGS